MRSLSVSLSVNPPSSICESVKWPVAHESVGVDPPLSVPSSISVDEEELEPGSVALVR